MIRSFAAFALAAAILTSGAASAAQRTVKLSVDHMFCAACPYIVKQSLAAVSGVSKVDVSFEKKTATVVYDDTKTTVAALTGATTEAGYPSKAIQ